MKNRFLFGSCVLILTFCVFGTVLWKTVRASACKAEHDLTFVIDAGHGGEDGGAAVSGVRESDINLSIALRLELLLRLCGEKTALTRWEDSISYPSSASTTRQRKMADLVQRVNLIHSTPHAVLISIHQNRFDSASAHGAQVFYGPEIGSEAFAVYTQNMLLALGENKRRAAAMSDDIYLIREAGCPAILVECGFLSNPAELALLVSDTYQTKVAVCLLSSCLGQRQELEQCYGEG